MRNVGLILLVIGASIALIGCERLNFAKGLEQQIKPEINFVCPAPESPCHHPQKQFEDGELSFRLPEPIVLYKTYESEPFYAVVLKIFPAPCSEFGANPQVENERAELQRMFSGRKVFAENGCGKLSAVEYVFAGKNNLKPGAAADLSFIAVYAGAKETEAREIFNSIRAEFPQAELKVMTARFRKVER